MNIEDFRTYCLSKKGTTEELPFGPDTLVIKVCGKLFALFPIDEFNRVNLKCDPELALTLRESFEAVISGYHMNKKHWNTVKIDGSIPDELLFSWVDHSYELVVNSLPKKVQAALQDR